MVALTSRENAKNGFQKHFLKIEYCQTNGLKFKINNIAGILVTNWSVISISHSGDSIKEIQIVCFLN